MTKENFTSLVKKGEPQSKAERQFFAFKLRQAGASYRDIGRKLGVSRMSAHRYVKSVLDEFNRKTALEVEAYRRLECERLDRILERIWEGVEAGNPKAVNAAMRNIEIRMKLLGLDRASHPAIAELDALKILVKAGWLSEELVAQIAERVGLMQADVQQLLAATFNGNGDHFQL